MQEQDFLAAIIASPDDIVPRLVYADWLEEQGDPRGEFIRVQCERETLEERDPRCVDLDYRERSLLAEHRNIWAKPVRKWGGRVIGFRRGFVEDITVRADVFLNEGEELLSVSPIRRVKLTHAKNLVKELANCQLLARLESLSLRDCKLGLARLEEFLKSRHISQIPGFDFSFNGLGPSAVFELIGCKRIGPLKSLSLDNCKLSGTVLESLLNSDLVGNLEKLELRSNDLANEDAIRIANCPKLSKLQELSLDFNDGITGSGVRALFESANLKSLRVLSLRDCSAGRDHESPFPNETPLKDLARLNLEGFRRWNSKTHFRQLAETHWADGLVHLNLNKCFAQSSVFDPLFQPGRLPCLRSLGIEWNKLDHRIVDRIEKLGTPYLSKLTAGGDVGNKGAKRLAQSEKFAKLNILNLRGTGITDPGARALAKSETLNRITELRMTTSPSEAYWNKTPGVSAKVTELLIQRFDKHTCYFD